MYDKVIILEIKEDYCLALTEDGAVIRIVKKDGLQEGNQIYVLEEDLYREAAAEKSGVVVPFTKNRKIKKSSLQKITAVAAAVLVCIASLTIPQMTASAYAAVSFDGDKSVQVELDRDGKVIDAVSFDHTMSAEELDQLAGKNITELADMTAELNQKDDDLIVVAYAGLKGGMDKSLKNDVNGVLGSREALYLEGSKDDVKAAKKEGKSLGMYMIEKAVSEDRLTDLLDGVSFDHVVKFLNKHRDLIPAVEAEKILKEKREEAKNGSKKPSDDDDEDDDDRDVDDDNDDEDDDDGRVAPAGKNDDDDDDQWEPDDNDDDSDEQEPADDDTEDDAGEEEEETDD